MRISLVLLTLFLSQLHAQMPEWFATQRYQPQKANVFVGYGLAKTLSQARSQAQEDIASQLQISVDASVSSQSKRLDEGESQNLQMSLKVQSYAVLSDIQTLKVEESEGMFYVVLSYENLDVITKLSQQVKQLECEPQEKNPYLLQTPLYKSIAKHFGCRPHVALKRKDRVWYLKHQHALVSLSPSDLEELFVSMPGNVLNFTSTQRTLYEGDSFSFTLLSNQQGYVTILSVYENGIVTVLSPSRTLGAKQMRQIPDAKDALYFEAGVINEGEDTYDLYVAIYTKKPLNTSRFEYADEELAQSESAYKFDELIELMAEHPFSTVFLRTKAR
jgi:hypothetical protein